MKREELIDEVAKMLKEKHGDPKRGAAAVLGFFNFSFLLRTEGSSDDY